MNASVRPAHEVANDLNAFVRVKSCHLAHRFSQTRIPSHGILCGAVRGLVEQHEVKLAWLSQVNTAALMAFLGSCCSNRVLI